MNPLSITQILENGSLIIFMQLLTRSCDYVNQFIVRRMFRITLKGSTTNCLCARNEHFIIKSW